MANIDVNQYMEQCGVRKARFGGYEPEDVRQALRALCSDYEQALARAAAENRAARQESDALRRRCQTLLGQNQTLSTQNATLAGQFDAAARRRDELESHCAALEARNHSLTDQVAVQRLKNSDLARDNKELTERAEDAEAALRIKGRACDEARQKVQDERDQVLAAAHAEGEKIRQKARDEAEALLKDTNRKAESIDQMARDQAIDQARKLVQAATDETREIQNAHRLRLQDLKARVDAMEQRRDALLDFLASMIEQLQQTQDAARRQSPALPEAADLPDETPEVELDLSDQAVAAAAAALPGEAADALPGQDSQPAPQPTAQVVQQPAAQPAAQPAQPPAAPAAAAQDVEIPGAIFSYPILRQEGAPILDEDPPLRGPHAPLLPDLNAGEEEDDDAAGGIRILPEPAPRPDPRRPKAVAALKALRRKLSGAQYRTGDRL